MARRRMTVLQEETERPLAEVGLTDNQTQCLSVIRNLGTLPEFHGFILLPANFMALCSLESGNPHRPGDDFDLSAERYEERLGESSYGVMQVLESTAAQFGMRGDPRQMFDPSLGILFGVRYWVWGWRYLLRHLQRPPTLAETFAGYNEGYAAEARGQADPTYVDLALGARQWWLSHL